MPAGQILALNAPRKLLCSINSKPSTVFVETATDDLPFFELPPFVVALAKVFEAVTALWAEGEVDLIAVCVLPDEAEFAGAPDTGAGAAAANRTRIRVDGFISASTNNRYLYVAQTTESTNRGAVSKALPLNDVADLIKTAPKTLNFLERFYV